MTEELGLAYVPDFIARQAVASRALQYVLEDQMGPNGAFWLLWPSSTHVPAKLRAFIDFFGPRLFAGRAGPAGPQPSGQRATPRDTARPAIGPRRAPF